MLQLLKETPARLIAAALKPQRTLAGLRYRWQTYKTSAAMPYAARLAPQDAGFKKLSFTFAIIALSARVATAGSHLTHEKYAAFREAFPLKGHLCGKIRSLFALACADRTPAEHYVLQIKYAFPDRAELFASLIDRLFAIASADGKVARPAERMLGDIAHLLDISPSTYNAICARHVGARPHEQLGVARHASQAAVKKRYRELMRSWHPDRFAAEGVSPDIELLLKLKTSEINEAYRALAKRAA